MNTSMVATDIYHRPIHSSISDSVANPDLELRGGDVGGRRALLLLLFLLAYRLFVLLFLTKIE